MIKITGKTAAEISESIRTLMRHGELRPGDSLPPVRDLAQVLVVNRNTVAAAYQRLVKTGIALTQGRLGTTLCEPPRAGEQEGLSVGTALIDLADGNPDPRWLADVTTVLANGLPKPFLYGEDTILPALRQFGETWLGPDSPPQWALELTHGAVDAIERLVAAHLAPGDKVAVEDPCFLGTINAVRLAGMQAIGVSMDEAGMQPDALAAALDKGARAVLLTPRAHNPTGWSLSRRRADALKRVLGAHPDVLVIADDHFALLAETPYYSVIPASTAHWTLVRSVSKGLGPDLRLAFVACDPETAERLRTRLSPGMTWVSHILQTIVAACLTSEGMRRQLDDAREAYANRRHELRTALLALGIDVPSSSGGFNVWVPLPKAEKDIAYELAKRGWLVRLGSVFDVQGECQAIRVTVSKLQEGQAQRFALDLKACLGS